MELLAWRKLTCGLLMVACLLQLATVAEGTFLDTYQQQLAELHKELKSEIGKRFRENSELNGQLIEQDVIPLLAEGTVEIRDANRDLLEELAAIRPTDATGECWESVDSLIYLYSLFSQWDLQDCAYAGYARWMREDDLERFYPIAHELHRASSEVINAVIGILSEDNVVSNGPDVEGRLDGTLDHFNEVSIEGLQDLDEEIAKHTDRQTELQQFLRGCIDRTVATSRADVEFTVRYAEYYCVEGNK
uniref:Secreted protein n=1 Tax=Anopheles epiroticus TaxID=199890 RepID=A0A182PEI5_9DIPT